MGRSDPIIFQWYIDHIYQKNVDKIAFLGFNGENSLTSAFNSDEKDFYDLGLGNWNINDSVRSPDNVVDERLKINSSDAESDSDALDFTSNGFKIRTQEAFVNASGGDYIYAAFAEFPFLSSNNIPGVAR